jgi:hypothetical protein
MSLHDISRDGRILISNEQGRREIIIGTRGASSERNLSWFDWSFLTDISADGSWIAFVEQGAAARGAVSTIYMRKVDGSPAVHLGDGSGRTISPDGKWIASMPDKPDRLDLLPIGAGDPRVVPVKGMEMMVWWNWFPDGKRLLVWGNEFNRGQQMFELAIDGDGTVRPVGPEGVTWPIAISPDGLRVAVTGRDDTLIIVSVANEGAPVAVPNSRRGDQAILWGSDNALYVYQFARIRTLIERIDLTTGERTVWQELKPADPAGVMNIHPAHVAADLKSYAYGFRRFLSELYIVEGLL